MTCGTWYDAATFACALRAPLRVSKVAASYLVPYVAVVAAYLAPYILATAAHAQVHAQDQPQIPAGEPGGPGLSLRCAKALVCAWEGTQVVDQARILVRDGKIEAIAPARELAVPDGYEDLDLGSRWICPGMIDLHCHVGGSFDINDMVMLANPELRVMTSVVPNNPNLQRAVAGAVTTVLYIPGSGTNCGGRGVLIKTGLERFADALVREPGSLKIAQWGNPERWGPGIGKTFENYTIRDIFKRGLGYAQAWEAHEKGEGPEPEFDLKWEVFRKLNSKETQVSTHTQVFQVVLQTITTIRGQFGVDVYIDHGEFGGYYAAKLAQDMGVPAIIGPRNVDAPTRGIMRWVGTREERFEGLVAAYQKGGHKQIGFNTDSPVMPQEELFLQASVGAHLGFDDSNLDTIRGLTIVPAKTAGIDGQVGSLEVGKDADIVVTSGDPVDPRSAVQLVLIEGVRVYDASAERRRF